VPGDVADDEREALLVQAQHVEPVPGQHALGRVEPSGHGGAGQRVEGGRQGPAQRADGGFGVLEGRDGLVGAVQVGRQPVAHGPHVGGEVRDLRHPRRGHGGREVAGGDGAAGVGEPGQRTAHTEPQQQPDQDGHRQQQRQPRHEQAHEPSLQRGGVLGLGLPGRDEVDVQSGGPGPDDVEQALAAVGGLRGQRLLAPHRVPAQGDLGRRVGLPLLVGRGQPLQRGGVQPDAVQPRAQRDDEFLVALQGAFVGLEERLLAGQQEAPQAGLLVEVGGQQAAAVLLGRGGRRLQGAGVVEVLRGRAHGEPRPHEQDQDRGGGDLDAAGEGGAPPAGCPARSCRHPSRMAGHSL